MKQRGKPVAGPDWEAIEREYRAGQLSVREIARQDGNVSDRGIAKHAAAHGWERNLADRVRTKVAETLVRDGDSSQSGSQAHARTEEAIVAAAAARGAEVVRKHIASIGRVHTVTMKLLDQLEDTTDSLDTVTDTIAADKDRDARNKRLALRAVDLPSRAQTVTALSTSLKTLVGLERQAFNLNAPGEGAEESPVERFRREVSGNRLEPVDA
jgi:hypothetical protein